MNIFIVIPIYNEIENIHPLLSKIVDLKRVVAKSFSADLHVVIIDDGSQDSPYSAIKRYNENLKIIFVAHQKNRGLGETLRTGFTLIMPHVLDNDAIVTMDGDNTHDPSLIIKMLRQFNLGTDVVIASRYQKGGCERGVPLARIFLSRIGNLLFRLMFSIPSVRDYSGGYRMIRGKTFFCVAHRTEKKFFSNTGFACMTELLLNLSECTKNFSEVPLLLRYDQKKGASKMIPHKTIMEYLSLIRQRIFK